MPQDDNGFQIPAFPKLPTDGKEFFNLLMQQIEPDLTLDHVHSLAEKYAEETDAEHKLRMERYRKALDTYREKRDHYFGFFTEEVKRFSRELAKKSEAAVMNFDRARFAELESIFSS